MTAVDRPDNGQDELAARELRERVVNACREHAVNYTHAYEIADSVEAIVADILAARPSADTETLRRERAAKWIYRKVMRARAGDLIIQIPPWDELTEHEQAGWLSEYDSLRAALDAR